MQLHGKGETEVINNRSEPTRPARGLFSKVLSRHLLSRLFKFVCLISDTFVSHLLFLPIFVESPKCKVHKVDLNVEQNMHLEKFEPLG